jgi:Protein of unknown function (DUF4232)
MRLSLLRSVVAGLIAAAGAFTVSGAIADAAGVGNACGNGSIRVSNTTTQGATGHGSFVLLFKNVGAVGCTLTGYPSVDAVNGTGQVLAHAQQTLSGFMGGAASVGTVSLAPGGFASATVEWLNFNRQTSGDCTFSTAVTAAPPGIGTRVHLSVSASICELQVHPTVLGTSGQGAPSGVIAGSGGLAASGESAQDQQIVLAAVGGGLLLCATAGIARRRQHPDTP